MFTGIIQEVGRVREIKRGVQSVRISIEAPILISKISVGDSICTNGVCLTVTNKGKDTFQADATPETVRRTTLFELRTGDPVNLEPALTLKDFLGGHIVSGHVDGIGTIKRMWREENALWLSITTDAEIIRYIVEKGSVSVDGISLTIAKIAGESFDVSIIPHTAQQTTLALKKTGDHVNIECDMIGRYVAKFLNIDVERRPLDQVFDKDFLRNNGFI